MTPGRRNSSDAVLKRRAIVSEMYLAGKTQYQISCVVHVTPQQVSQDLRRIREQWRNTTLLNVDEKVGLELARVDQVEHEAWKAWDDSIGKHAVVMEKEGKDGIETITRTEKLSGDPRFLVTMLRCVDIRCRILGLYARTGIRATYAVGLRQGSSALPSIRVEYINLLTDGSSDKGNNRPG